MGRVRGSTRIETSQARHRPTRAELEAARELTVPDTIGRDLRVLFVGINPGLYSAAIGRHFGRPGNRFWPAMFAGGFTPRLYSPFEGRLLLADGIGITNLVDRATATADELTPGELRAGARRLARKVRRYRPAITALLGLTSYRTAFGRPDARIGKQAEQLAGSVIWVLPNPSGLNAHFQPARLARLFSELRIAADKLARTK